jgi:hypothetical protein
VPSDVLGISNLHVTVSNPHEILYVSSCKYSLKFLKLYCAFHPLKEPDGSTVARTEHGGGSRHLWLSTVEQ